MPDLAPGFEAMPRLAAETPAAHRVNQDLVGIDHAALAESDNCRGTKGSDWARWVVVANAGPDFLSLTERHDLYCAGAAHPNHFHSDYTYDLTTGLPVDWPTLLPARLAPVPRAFSGRGRTDSAWYASFALTRLYEDHRPDAPAPDCANFEKDLHFTFSLSAASHSLVMTPVGYAYVQTPCADPAFVLAETLRALGASPRLVEALDRAP
jgi:hypothetical protein